MFKEQKLYPVWSEENKNSFVDSDLIAPTEISYKDGRESHLTSFLKLGAIIDLDGVFIKPIFGNDKNIQIEYNCIRLAKAVGRVDGFDQLIVNNNMDGLYRSKFMRSNLDPHLHVLNTSDFLTKDNVTAVSCEEVLVFANGDNKPGVNISAIINSGAGLIVDSSADSAYFKKTIPFDVLGYSLDVSFIDTNRFR